MPTVTSPLTTGQAASSQNAGDSNPAAAAVWYESPGVCALADAERHLGHAVRSFRGWVAYDGTHLNPEGNGFNHLGTFAELPDAKAAIEDAVGFCQPRTMAAGGSFWMI